MLYPLSFKPVLMERVWGGRRLAELYDKELPGDAPYGESWEITDRPEAVSEILNGPLAGRNLRWLMENHRDDLLGSARDHDGHFPLLIKILDSSEKLSLQVHPPAAKAAELRGEPKTEMWYVADASPDADIFVGLKPGVTPGHFRSRIDDGTVADCFHRHLVKRGDVMFLPSGRVHALGAGSVIFEIQQNSNTTYRVFDWNRVGLDGKPRDLHINEAMESIDFEDIEPALVDCAFSGAPVAKRTLVNDPLFTVENWRLNPGEPQTLPSGQCRIVAALDGVVEIGDGRTSLRLKAGQFGLLPACLPTPTLTAVEAGEVLMAIPGQ